MIDRRQLFLIASAILLAGRAEAHSFTQGAIEIGHPWARPTTAREGAVYLVLATRGTSGDRLIGATTPFAERVEIRDELGNPVDGFDVLPKHPFALRPSRRSLALIGLKRVLAIGDSFPLTLRFRDAGEAAVTVMVEAAPGA